MSELIFYFYRNAGVKIRTEGVAMMLAYTGLTLSSGIAMAASFDQEYPPGAAVPRPVRVESSTELAKMEAFVQSLYSRSDVRNAFGTVSGDEIDCVDIKQQPGMRRPEMRGQPVFQPPAAVPSAPTMLTGPAGATKNANAAPPAGKTAAAAIQDAIFGGKDSKGAVRSCPAGSIPIRRITTEELRAFKNLREFQNKYPDVASRGGTTQKDLPPALGPSDSHQYAHAARNVNNVGAHSIINVWHTRVQAVANEFSLGQIWVARGFGTSQETVEVGFQVYPRKYGDTKARLFIFSTSDGYSGFNYGSGCYNLECGRFVQTNSSVVIGGALKASVTSGTQRELEVAWVRAGNPAAWWLRIGNQWIGYYPLNLFDSSGLRNGASNIDFGGEIVDDRQTHTGHTRTDMGSSTGAYPSAGYGIAAYQKQLWYYTSPSTAQHASQLAPWRNNANCYDISPVSFDATTGYYFYFGGPGYGSKCK